MERQHASISKKELDEYVRARLEEALGLRSWSWLARKIDVPLSTLTAQVRKPHFSLFVLLRSAAVLERDLAFFLPPGAPVAAPGSDPELLERLEEFLARARA